MICDMYTSVQITNVFRYIGTNLALAVTSVLMPEAWRTVLRNLNLNRK